MPETGFHSKPHSISRVHVHSSSIFTNIEHMTVNWTEVGVFVHVCVWMCTLYIYIYIYLFYFISLISEWVTIASILCNLVDVQEKAAFWEETAHAVNLQLYNSVLILCGICCYPRWRHIASLTCKMEFQTVAEIEIVYSHTTLATSVLYFSRVYYKA